VKLLMVGDRSKSALMHRFCDEYMHLSFMATIGLDFKIRTVPINNKVVKLQIWDSAAQERYRAVTTSFYRGAHGILLVYDSTDATSFEHASNWMQSIREHAGDKLGVVLAGSKCEDADKKVTAQEGEVFALQNGLQGFFEVSAKTGCNVSEAFLTLASDCLQSLQLAAQGAEVPTRTSRALLKERKDRLRERALFVVEQLCEIQLHHVVALVEIILAYLEPSDVELPEVFSANSDRKQVKAGPSTKDASPQPAPTSCCVS